mmetsp:Transcript_28369/g.72014  ORF Transcript_28369/g.72014 Transcript_28369/m.72014 type:complete len:209 (-) Transcript_28369:848-1474(-)
MYCTFFVHTENEKLHYWARRPKRQKLRCRPRASRAAPPKKQTSRMKGSAILIQTTMLVRGLDVSLRLSVSLCFRRTVLPAIGITHSARSTRMYDLLWYVCIDRKLWPHPKIMYSGIEYVQKKQRNSKFKFCKSKKFESEKLSALLLSTSVSSSSTSSASYSFLPAFSGRIYSLASIIHGCWIRFSNSNPTQTVFNHPHPAFFLFVFLV